MAASRSLNDPVVIVTLVRACAAPAGCTAIATNRTNVGMEKLKSFIFITSSGDLALWNVPTLMKSLNAVKPAVVLILGPGLSHNFSQEIRKTPRITSTVAPIFRGVSVSTSLRNSIDSGRTKREEAFTSGEIIETRSRLSAV